MAPTRYSASIGSCLCDVSESRCLRAYHLSLKATTKDFSKQIISAKMLSWFEHARRRNPERAGTATRAAVPGYRVAAAKTGTSRKSDFRWLWRRVLRYTAGVAPVSDPRVSLVVMINEPQGDLYYGGSVAALFFCWNVKGALQILNVPADERNTKFQE